MNLSIVALGFAELAFLSFVGWHTFRVFVPAEHELPDSVREGVQNVLFRWAVGAFVGLKIRIVRINIPPFLSFFASLPAF